MARWCGRAKAVLVATFALVSPSTSFKLYPDPLQKVHCQHFLIGERSGAESCEPS